MSNPTLTFQISRSTALENAPRDWFYLFGLAVLLGFAIALLPGAMSLNSGLFSTLTVIVLGMLAVALVHYFQVVFDRRIVVLKEDRLQFRDPVFFKVPLHGWNKPRWSQIQAIDIGSLPQFSFVHFKSGRGRQKSVKLALHLLDPAICDRFIEALGDYPVRVHRLDEK